MPAPDRPALPTVHLFTDIEDSTRLWESQPERMRAALAAHDALARELVERWGGRVVKTTGDGLHAVFDRHEQGVWAAVAMQRALADPATTGGLGLALRCGLHAGADEARGNDFYGRDVNRAARIMSIAHGGQVLLSDRVAQALRAGSVQGLDLKPLGAVRLRGMLDAEAVHQVLAEGLRQDFPALRGLAETPHNLPQSLNRFVGRQSICHELAAALVEHRLVTLWGPGGIGKSRLSLEIGRRLLDDFVDGVWLVELAPLADGAGVGPAVAAALGVKQSPGQDLSQALDAHVRGREMLLILDNCEHVHSAAAAQAKALLQAGQRLRVLASSRELLHVAGEQAFVVPALSVPVEEAATPCAAQPSRAADAAHEQALLAHDAVQLFVERAQSAAPGFVLDPDNAASVAAICRRLDGIPLALELAAARVRAMPVQTIAERLTDSFRLVATRDRTVPERQRTLQVLIDWSWNLLAADERRLFTRLSVFAGGFSLEAAEAICADADESLDALGEAAVATEAVIDLLSQLVDKSLLVAEPAQGRYRLLDTVRLYAAGQCPDDERAALGQRHLEWCTELAERAAPHLNRADAADWLARLDLERPNLLAAHRFATTVEPAMGVDPAADGVAERERLRIGLAFRLGFALRSWFMHRGRLTAALELLRAALAHPAAGSGDALRARALFDVGHLCNFLGRPAEARDALEQSLSIVQALGQTVREISILQPLGLAHAALGERDRALACFEAAVARARGLADAAQLTSALVCLAQWHQTAERWDSAELLYDEALSLAHSRAEPESVTTILVNLGMTALARGALSDALQRTQAALGHVRQVGSARLQLAVLDLAGALAVACDDAVQARAWLAASDALCQRTGLHRDTGDEAALAPWRRRLAQAPAEPALVDGAGAASGNRYADPLEALSGLAAWLAARTATAPQAKTPDTTAPGAVPPESIPPEAITSRSR